MVSLTSLKYSFDVTLLHNCQIGVSLSYLTQFFSKAVFTQNEPCYCFVALYILGLQNVHGLDILIAVVELWVQYLDIDLLFYFFHHEVS